MPVYNRERYVEAAVRSVIAQTMPRWELLIRDDGSTDGTPDILRRLAKEDPRVRVIFGQHVGRPAAGTRELASLARGELHAWLDSDDLLAPTALDETAKFIDADPSCGLVYTDYLVIDADGSPRGLGARCKIPYSKERLLSDFMVFHLRVYRAELYATVGGIDDTMSAAADYDFVLKMSEVATIRHLPRALYHYRVHGDSISAERRVQQINASASAIRAAMARRGMETQYELDVEIVGKFTVRKKPQSP